MTEKEYLEYLALDSILQGYMSASCLNDYSTDTEVYLPYDHMHIDVKKVKIRVAELQKKFLEPYAIDKPLKKG